MASVWLIFSLLWSCLLLLVFVSLFFYFSMTWFSSYNDFWFLYHTFYLVFFIKQPEVILQYFSMYVWSPLLLFVFISLFLISRSYGSLPIMIYDFKIILVILPFYYQATKGHYWSRMIIQSLNFVREWMAVGLSCFNATLYNI